MCTHGLRVTAQADEDVRLTMSGRRRPRYNGGRGRPRHIQMWKISEQFGAVLNKISYFHMLACYVY